jgi:hypothetical protein
MLKVYLFKFLAHPDGRLLALAGLITLVVLAAAFRLVALQQPGPGEVRDTPAQADPARVETRSTETLEDSRQTDRQPGRESAGTEGTNQGRQQGSGQGGAHGSGK